MVSLFTKFYYKSGSHDKITHFVYVGGFGGNVGHDPHILYTLSAVQVLALFDKLNVLDIDKITNCIPRVIDWCVLKLFTKYHAMQYCCPFYIVGYSY